MKTNPTSAQPPAPRRNPLLLAVIAFALGVALAAVWFHKHENDSVAVAAPAPPAPEVARPSPAITASIKKLIPDVSTVSVEQADQIFHAEFLKRCGELGTELEKQINAAQQKVMAAQTGGTPVDLEAAQKNLAQVQLAQAEKLKAIAADLPVQLAVFQRIKNGDTNAVK